jgi:hypothetical protein
MAALEIPERLGAPPIHAEQVGRAGHVNVEEGAAHQKVGRLSRHVFGELGQSLGGDHASEAALAPAAHQVGHGGQREAPCLLLCFSAGRGCEQLCLIHHHQCGRPLLAGAVEQAGQEGGGMAKLAVHVQPFQVQHHGYAVGPDLLGGKRHGGFRMRGGVDDEVAMGVRQGDEIAFRVDHNLLHPGCALFQ